MSYLPCELHCHTRHSDGGFTVRELQQAALDDHLALIALTDHNTASGVPEADQSLLPVVEGMEWTTYYGHMLVLNAERFVDWRSAKPNNIDEKVTELKAAGAVVGCAHPFQLGSPICTGGRWEFRVQDWNQFDYLEIWHDAFTPDNPENEQGLALFTNLLDRGIKITPTYGRDWHRPEPPENLYGCTYLGIDGAATPEHALAAIRAGRSVVSSGAKLLFRIHQKGSTYTLGDTLQGGNAIFSFFTDLHSREKNRENANIEYRSIKIITRGGRCVCETAVSERHIHLKLEKHSWYRAELWGTMNGQKLPLAVTAAVYTE